MMRRRGAPFDPAIGPLVPRRVLLGGAAVGALAFTAFSARGADEILGGRDGGRFVPLSIPGEIVKVSKEGSLQPNGLWPKEDCAREMLTRAMQELTGKSSLGDAFGQLLHKDDRVAIKINGIAGRLGSTMATNKELVVEVVRGVLAAGVAPSSVVLYEQFRSFLMGARVIDRKGALDPQLPAGVRAAHHDNSDADTDVLYVCGVPTRYVKPLTDATAVINVAMIKDHSICGYTGCLKNITHGSIINPGAFHDHVASPQIAELYAQSAVKRRVVLHIVDAFKIIYEGGPLDRDPARRVPTETIYATTDPVAMDTIGWGEVERLRRDKGLPSLKSAGREPSYIRIAAELGLGLHDLDRIHVREVKL